MYGRNYSRSAPGRGLRREPVERAPMPPGRFEPRQERFEQRDAPHLEFNQQQSKQTRPRSRKPKGQTNLRPSRVDGERSDVPPKPQAPSVSSTAPKNDPLYMESFLPVPSQESRPIAQELVVYPATTALSTITRQIHQTVSAFDNGFSRRVPESVFAYYVACLVYARLLKCLKMFSRPVTSDEENFMDMVYHGNFQPPASLGAYLQGFGNFNRLTATRRKALRVSVCFFGAPWK